VILAARQSRDEKRHVVGFRRRHAKADASGRPRGHVQEGDINVSSLLSLAKYECDGQVDEYRHRMIMNGLAFVVTVALIAAGVWLASNLRG
jgi:hypothetical protein